MSPHDNRAWLLILPALALLGAVGVLPLLAVFNYGFHDIFTLADPYWVGLQWYEDILQAPEFLASLGRSLLFSALTLGIQLPLGIAVAKLLIGLRRGAVAGLMLVALPLVVPWNMIPMMWLGLVDARTGLIGPVLAAVGFDWKFTAWHTWALILAMDCWHWLGLVVVLSYASLHRRGQPLGGVSPHRTAAHGWGAVDRAAVAVRGQLHDLYRGLRDQRGRAV